MLPTLDEVTAALPFLARRFGLPEATEATTRAIHAAIEEARDLATNEADEPAAMFYALARRPSGLREWWPAICRVLPISMLTRSDRTLRHDEDEIHRLRLGVVIGTTTLDDVRTWFAART